MSSNRRASFPVNVLRRSPRRRTKTPSVNELPKKCSEYMRSLFLWRLYVVVSSNVVNLMFWLLAVDANYRDAALWSSIVLPSSLLCWDQLGLTKPLLSGGILSYTSTMMALSYLEIHFYYNLKTSMVSTTLLRLAKIGSCGFESLFECL